MDKPDPAGVPPLPAPDALVIAAVVIPPVPGPGEERPGYRRACPRTSGNARPCGRRTTLAVWGNLDRCLTASGSAGVSGVATGTRNGSCSWPGSAVNLRGCARSPCRCGKTRPRQASMSWWFPAGAAGGSAVRCWGHAEAVARTPRPVTPWTPTTRSRWSLVGAGAPHAGREVRCRRTCPWMIPQPPLPSAAGYAAGTGGALQPAGASRTAGDLLARLEAEGRLPMQRITP